MTKYYYSTKVMLDGGVDMNKKKIGLLFKWTNLCLRRFESNSSLWSTLN